MFADFLRADVCGHAGDWNGLSDPGDHQAQKSGCGASRQLWFAAWIIGFQRPICGGANNRIRHDGNQTSILSENADDLLRHLAGQVDEKMVLDVKVSRALPELPIIYLHGKRVAPGAKARCNNGIGALYQRLDRLAFHVSKCIGVCSPDRGIPSIRSQCLHCCTIQSPAG